MKFYKLFIVLGIICLFLLLSCMYARDVKTKEEEEANTNKEIKLVLNELNNTGSTLEDRFWGVIESGNYYIAVGYSESNLSGLTGGTNTQGFTDFVIAKFNKSDLSLVNINNLGGIGVDYFRAVIESGSYYIVTGFSSSNLTSLNGGTDTAGVACKILGVL